MLFVSHTVRHHNRFSLSVLARDYALSPASYWRDMEGFGTRIATCTAHPVEGDRAWNPYDEPGPGDTIGYTLPQGGEMVTMGDFRLRFSYVVTRILFCIKIVPDDGGFDAVADYTFIGRADACRIFSLW